ncbi:UNVERIFIED_CONTAM: hypothetical protein GTU68_011883, partial [Idotea baltica]|nr:hypothetical protein [Idotea baltica]
GIVGAIAERNVLDILLEGLRRLEYRGYDSSGVALVDSQKKLHSQKALGKVSELSERLSSTDIQGTQGIAHTRWATHGKPSEINAHPHFSEHIAVVHNGIIENHAELRAELISSGYEFLSETDTEVVAHLLHREYAKSNDLLSALKSTISRLVGAYALCVLSSKDPESLYVAREGSPLVIGLGIGENYVASDQMALRPVTDRFVFLEEGDYGRISRESVDIRAANGESVVRESNIVSEDSFDAEKGVFKHYMLKEIFEQPEVINSTIEGRIGQHGVMLESLGIGVPEMLNAIESIDIVACGTSYHAGMVAKFWMEEHLGLPVRIEVASEYRYRRIVVQEKTLLITISQSGETADTLAAL